MSSSSEFLSGMRRSPAVVISSAPFGLLFGALAVENGLSVGEAVLMSATIFAGASQMVGIDLFGQAAPWLIAFSIFAVNFRHLLYSAAIGRRVGHWSTGEKGVGFFFLVDPQYAESERRAEDGHLLTFAWYMGMALPVYVFWIINSWLGAAFGQLIPNPYALGLDFLLPIYFLALVMDFRDRPLWLPVVAASAVASIAVAAAFPPPAPQEALA
jgi:predicted branched-subunit amino acid permease